MVGTTCVMFQARGIFDQHPFKAKSPNFTYKVIIRLPHDRSLHRMTGLREPVVPISESWIGLG